MLFESVPAPTTGLVLVKRGLLFAVAEIPLLFVAPVTPLLMPLGSTDALGVTLAPAAVPLLRALADAKDPEALLPDKAPTPTA